MYNIEIDIKVEALDMNATLQSQPSPGKELNRNAHVLKKRRKLLPKIRSFTASLLKKSRCDSLH